MQYVIGWEFDETYTRPYIESMDGSSIGLASRLDEAMRTARPPLHSQKELEERTETFGRRVSQATISRTLKGQGKRGPETETLKSLAAACGVNFNWLNEGIGPKYLGMENPTFVEVTMPKISPINIKTDSQNDAEQLAEIVSLFLILPHAGKNFMVKSAKAAKKRFLSQHSVTQNPQ